MSKQQSNSEPAWMNAEGGHDANHVTERPMGDEEFFELEATQPEYDPTAADGPSAVREEKEEAQVDFKLPAPQASRKIPEFARGKVPKELRLPRGLQVVCVSIPKELTPRPDLGDRVLLLWELSEGDEKLAVMRAMGDGARVGAEFAKQMVRAIDGHVARWDGMPGPGSVDALWREIGAKGRNLLMKIYVQINQPNRDELQRFFERCVAVVPMG